MITEGVVVRATGSTAPEALEETMHPEETLPAYWVPHEAYLAADTAFDMDFGSDAPGGPGGPDELWLALSEAAPYIRASEVERHLCVLQGMATVPEVLAYLTDQLHALRPPA